MIMKIINKFPFLFLYFLINCKTHNVDIPVKPGIELVIEKPPITGNSETHSDESNYIFLDTIENGEKIKICYDGLKSRIKSKTFKNEIWNYKDGKLISKVKDTILNSVKLFSKEEKNGDEIIITKYEKKNLIKEYESIYKYKKGKLVSKIIVRINKKGNPIENKTGYDEDGKINLKLEREHRAYHYPKENQNNEITEYFELGKKYQWSKLVYKESKSYGEGNIIRLEELSFYNLKNELIKKEFLKDISGIYRELFSDDEPKIVQEIKLIKTEYYEKGKLIKTVENLKN